MTEIWKIYKDTRIRKDGRKNGTGGIYEISTYGRLKKNGEIISYEGYEHKIARIVAKTFIPNPENKPEVDHIDTDITNNCINNLRWVTHKENMNNNNTILNIQKSKRIYFDNGGKSGMEGKHHSEHTKEKMSNSHIGKSLLDNTKKKISKTLKEYFDNPEIKLKYSNLRKGKHHSEHTKEKMSIAHLGKKSYINGKHRVYENIEHTKWHFE